MKDSKTTWWYYLKLKRRRPNLKYKDFIHATKGESSGAKDNECNDENKMNMMRVMEWVMTQFSLNKGFNVFGQEREKTTKKELE